MHNGLVPRSVSPPRPARSSAASRGLIWLGTRFAALIAVLALGAAPARAASITVTRTPVGSAIPAGFLGISTEVQDLETFTGTNPKALDPAFLRLLGAIAPGQRPVLRIGGDSTDWSWFPVAGQRKPPGVTYTITQRWLAVARAAAQALNGKLVVGVNLEAGNRAIAAGEARAMLHGIGARYIDAMEIGNEPELYHHFPWYHTSAGVPVKGRSNAYSEPTYFAQFKSFARALPRVPVAGPVFGFGTWLDHLGDFLNAAPFTSLVTIHAYPLQHCTPSHLITIPEVLSKASSQGFVATVTPYVRVAQAHHKPIRIDEVNAISCGGTAGVSDSFGSALWMVNTLFGLARTGVGGVNVHMTPGAINAILNPVGNGSARAIAVQPEYYAMMLFAQAAPPGAHIVRLAATGLPAGEQAWATRDQSGTVRVVLINQRSAAAAPTTLTIPGVTGPAAVQSLRARGLAATGDVTLGGQTFGAATSTGELAGTPQQQSVVPIAGRYTTTVPPASVQMLTLRQPAGALLVSALAAPDLLTPLIASW